MGISYFLPVRLSVMVSVSAMSTRYLRRQRAVAAPEYGSRPRSSVPDLRACTVRCRRGARPDRPDAGGSTRTQVQAAPCATRLLYLMTIGGLPGWLGQATERSERACT